MLIQSDLTLKNIVKPQYPLVSVIIPTYNRPFYLQEALKSAARQTYQNLEIIVSDNCSSENPEAIVESFQDSRIQFWRNKTNIGMCANVMNAFKRAQGKYVACLNDDDMWNEDFLAKLIPHLEANPTLNLAFCDHYVVDANGDINAVATDKHARLWKRHQLHQGIYKPFHEIGLIHKSFSTGINAVIRKEAVEWDEIPVEVGNMWDVYVTYLCSRDGYGAYYHPERLTRYRVHGQNDTALSGRKDVQTKIRNARAEIFCNKIFMEDERLKQFKSYFRKKWLRANTTLGIGLIRNGQIAEARPFLRLALSHQKFDLRALAAFTLSFAPPGLASRF